MVPHYSCSILHFAQSGPCSLSAKLKSENSFMTMVPPLLLAVHPPFCSRTALVLSAILKVKTTFMTMVPLTTPSSSILHLAQERLCSFLIISK
ncbi:hypothetical protein AVEN_172013-1 [Araneus ventricosus]|uniref:Uncharacterized protein n=1 Tax=Araneus ventricosus TaxID=182803 RepID=A0A4Y2LD74_ARAVE|nr:hypothetical protein AVEN_172013-1 [Araneus ventricosus]